MAHGIDPKVDIAFRKLFGGEETAPLLVDLLNALVGPAKPVTEVEFVLPQSEKSSPDDKVTVGDVKARDQGGRQFQVKMQWVKEWFFRKRLLFYWGQFHTRQLRQGEHYMTLRPTVSISFLNQSLFPGVADHHLTYQAREVKLDIRLSDDFGLHLIELPKSRDSRAECESV